jgi:hypothetical protein
VWKIRPIFFSFFFGEKKAHARHLLRVKSHIFVEMCRKMFVKSVKRNVFFSFVTSQMRMAREHASSFNGAFIEPRLMEPS